MAKFEIFIDDLKDDIKEELIEFLGGDNGNFDFIPLAIVENDEEEDDDGF